MGGRFGDGQKISRERAEEITSQFLSMLPVDEIVGYEICGSYRRMKDLIGDVELFILSKPGWEKWMGEVVGFSKIGTPKRSYVLDGVQIDLFATEHRCQVGAFLAHCTGSWETNRNMRFVAQRKGLLLNQYGLFKPISEEEFVDNDPHYYRKRKRVRDPWQCFSLMSDEREASVWEGLGSKYKEPKDR